MLPPTKKLTSVDQLFAILRVITILGGVSWVFLIPLSPFVETALMFTFGFFCVYRIIIYLLIFLTRLQIKTAYHLALFLDLLFLYLLVRLTGGIQSDFELAFLLLIALIPFTSDYRWALDDTPFEDLAIDTMEMLVDILEQNPHLEEIREDIHLKLLSYYKWDNCGITDYIANAAEKLSADPE